MKLYTSTYELEREEDTFVSGDVAAWMYQEEVLYTELPEGHRLEALHSFGGGDVIDRKDADKFTWGKVPDEELLALRVEAKLSR